MLVLCTRAGSALGGPDLQFRKSYDKSLWLPNKIKFAERFAGANRFLFFFAFLMKVKKILRVALLGSAIIHCTVNLHSFAHIFWCILPSLHFGIYFNYEIRPILVYSALRVCFLGLGGIRKETTMA